MMSEFLLEELDLKKSIIQTLDETLFKKKSVTVSVLRTDRIHPVISGNKWFKLKYHLQEAIEQGYRGIISFGGAYSNHLVATAYAGKLAGIPTKAVVRGECPPNFSPTLQTLSAFDMQLHFVSREDYRDKQQMEAVLSKQYPGFYWIPEGGQSPLGVKGAREILTGIDLTTFSHIICAVGTGTMMAGLLASALPQQRVCGIPVLKIDELTGMALKIYIGAHSYHKNHELLFGFHEGGYAKKNKGLIDFMNELYQKQSLPTDFVYTGKLFKAIYALVHKGHFPTGSHLLAIHSGGLQGNLSLPTGSLCYD